MSARLSGDCLHVCRAITGTDRWLYEFGKSGKERVVGLNLPVSP